MQLSVVAAFVLAALVLLVSSSALVKAYGQSEPMKCQINALIGYGGSIFGLANVCTDGNKIDVDLTTNYIPQSGKVFEAWLVDDGAKGSGYMLSMGKFLNSGILHFHEVMNNATTYTDIVVTQEPAGDLSPLASWSNSVGQTWLLPPFGL
ncbi:MAG: hypothetical protein WAK17_13030 [Candidatus Nitrosopolaris sp.]|jgi:hypothetical protein